MSGKATATEELKLSAHVHDISFSNKHYVVMYGEKSLALLDGDSGSQLMTVTLGEQVYMTHKHVTHMTHIHDQYIFVHHCTV